MESTDSNSSEVRVSTLQTEILEYVSSLPYWGEYIANQILLGNEVSNETINTSYQFLLEDLGLIEKTEHPEIEFKYLAINNTGYKSDLILYKIQDVEGVNALAEKQTIEFNKQFTILYGENGSGKSGYTRLLKNVFYSKEPEQIIPNIYSSERKSVNAKFVFLSEGTEENYTYEQRENPIFRQFSVFDGKGLIRQLSGKNEFEFRPAGLSFFAKYAEAIKALEEILNSEIDSRRPRFSIEDLRSQFDGESEITKQIENLYNIPNITELKKQVPFSDEDKKQKELIQKEYDEIKLANVNAEKKAKELISIKTQLEKVKSRINELNALFSKESIDQLNGEIKDYLNKEELARQEGISSFQTDQIQNIGSTEWKNFISAAEKFATKQGLSYPQNGDTCIFCHQHLTPESEALILKYWKYLKSEVEKEFIKARQIIQSEKEKFEKASLDLFNEDSILVIWLKENYSKNYENVKKQITELDNLRHKIIVKIEKKNTDIFPIAKIEIEEYEQIVKTINESISKLSESEQSKQLTEIGNKKRYYEHKEKLNNLFREFENTIIQNNWIQKAQKANFKKRSITEKEKSLSDKYYNQEYIRAFNEECAKLNGNFEINIEQSGSGGKTFRQLKIKGNQPNAILSEGEQKVIAIADFLAEMSLSEINRGLIFDDPVTSLDNKRKKTIANRLASESIKKQIIVFTHDLVFVSHMIDFLDIANVKPSCHWIEHAGDHVGIIWKDNAPSLEKNYKNAEIPKACLKKAKNVAPEQRDNEIKVGFSALRTCYESLVVFELFGGVVQRFQDRISIESLKDAITDSEIRQKINECFGSCCRFMEGHLHSDAFAYQKPTLDDLNKEIQRFEDLKSIIKKWKKENNK